MRVPPERFQPLLLLLALVLLFLPAGGLRDWWYPDEPDVALPAIEMAARGDWVVPTHNGNAWLDYPPLAYWGARAVGVATGNGITPWGTRLPMVVFAGLMVAATMMLGRGMGQGQRGLLAGVVLIATPAMWFHATNLQVDLGYAAFIAFGLACYHRADACVSRGVWLRIAAFACFGVAILGKGPLGVLLPGLILTCWHAWNREWRRLFLLAPLALVSLVVALPWYLFLCERLGTDVVVRELLLQNTDRFGAAKRGHGGHGYFYYFTNVAPDLGLWVALIIPALWRGFREQRSDRSWRLLAVWILAPFIFFTLASTKRNVYMLPIFPAVAVMVAGWLQHPGTPWEQWWSRWSSRMFTGLLGLVGITLLGAGLAWGWLPTPGFVLPATKAAMQPAAIVIGLYLVVACTWTMRQAGGDPFRVWMALSLIGTLGFSLVMWLVLPVIDTVRTYQPAAQWLVGRVPAGGTVGFHVPGRENTKRPAWLCYLDGRHLAFFTTPAEASEWLAADHTRLLLTEPKRIPDIDGAQTVITWRISNDDWAVVAAKP